MRSLAVSLLLVAACAAGILAPAAGAASLRAPRRVAVITSSGVNGDKRSWDEYDSRLKVLGWAFDKVPNTELGRLFDRGSDYDLVLTTSLWNYGDPQEMRRFIPRWEEYVNRGGVVILTDMAYPPMVDWVADWHKELRLEPGNASEDLGAERATLDLSAPSRFLSEPFRVGALSYWPHFRRWGEAYQVWARTKAGTAIGLAAVLGEGAVVATTAWSFSGEMLQNLYTNAVTLKSGVWVTWLDVPDPMAPGTFRGQLLIENVSAHPKRIELHTLLRQAGAKDAAAGPPFSLELPASARKRVAVTLPCGSRGDFEAVAIYRVGAGAASMEVAHPLRVPPLVTLELARSRFTRSDRIEMVVRTAPAAGEAKRCSLTVLLKGGSSRVLLPPCQARPEQRVVLPARDLPAGDYEARAEAVIQGGSGERLVATAPFRVLSIEHPERVTRFGPNGEFLINGKPAFPIGTYHVDAGDLKRVRDLGFNCVTGPIYDGQQTELNEGQLAWHDEAERQGLWVVTELSEFIRGGRRNLAQARSLVSILRAHPATVAHYAIDEPVGCGIGTDVVGRFCKVLRETDPDHPNLVLEVPGEVLRYACLGDATGTDPYPIGSGTPESLASVGACVKATVAAAKGRPVWVAIQGHRQPPPPPNGSGRFPTPAEIRCMAYLALNNGAKGLLFYAWGDVYSSPQGEWPSGFRYSPGLQDNFGKLNPELQEIGLHYAQGRAYRDRLQVEPKDAPLDANWLVHGKWKAAIVINPTSRRVAATVTTPAGRERREFAPFEVQVVRP